MVGVGLPSTLGVRIFGPADVGMPYAFAEMPRLPPGVPVGASSFAPGWTNVTSQVGTPPPVRGDPAMAYDAADGYMLLFGGCGAVTSTGACTAVLGDSWIFKDGLWSNITGSVGTAPSPRYSALMAYDAADRYVVLFSGEFVNGTWSNTTWKFSGGAWTQLHPTTSPPAGLSGGLTYDAADGYVVMFNGGDNETWKFSAGQWSQLTTSDSPGARGGAAVVYDPAPGAGYVLLWGGSEAGDPFEGLNDTWEFSDGNWIQLHPTTSPPARAVEDLTYDAVDGEMVLFGGGTDNSFELNDTWAFVGGDWRSVVTRVAPSDRGEFGFAYDSGNHSVVLFGGCAGTFGCDDLAGDTWTFAQHFPLATLLSSSSATIRVGESLVLGLIVSGGVPPVSWTLEWSGSSANLATGYGNSTYSFTALSRGVDTFYMNASDSAGSSSNSTVTAMVIANPAQGGFLGLSGDEGYLLLGGTAVAVAAVAAGIWVARRRPGRSTP